MKVNIENIGGEVIRDTEVYTVTDNKFLNNLTLSKTVLHPLNHTSGHSHKGLEEVYFFYKGSGRMQLNDEFFDVKEGEIVLIPDGAFHKVYNDNKKEDLIFVCVFQKYDR